MKSKKRRRQDPPKIHPRNRYSDKPPDFALLASLYPSFRPFVSAAAPGRRPSIDWTDFNATRELTRTLLLHDHNVNWWIPDGQLCPTVPNRSNYIHWIDDLLSSGLIPAWPDFEGKVKGFDIGTGANCIYPLLGASLLGWKFVGSDVTDVALECAKKNVESNPHLSDLIEVRDANRASYSSAIVKSTELIIEGGGEQAVVDEETKSVDEEAKPGNCLEPFVLVGVVNNSELFDFCMCNPPFFESIEEAGLNPKTSCGGTSAEMVCRGGERTFISRIIDDSVVLKSSFRWFTSMVGRKANLKFLMSRLREIGVSVVKTTEFVQGQTARWGLAWSFMTPNKSFVASGGPTKRDYSFTLEGVQRQFGAFQVLKWVESFFLAIQVPCKLDVPVFCINITLSDDQINLVLKSDSCNNGSAISLTSTRSNEPESSNQLSFRISVFEQIPGTLLVRALLHRDSPYSGNFSLLLMKLEAALRKEFIKSRES